MIQGNNGTGTVLYSKEGVSQGGPLVMVAYGIRPLPIIWQPKHEFLVVNQPWYTNDAAAGLLQWHKGIFQPATRNRAQAGLLPRARQMHLGCEGT
jgi:hypothetical protein